MAFPDINRHSTPKTPYVSAMTLSADAPVLSGRDTTLRGPFGSG